MPVPRIFHPALVGFAVLLSLALAQDATAQDGAAASAKGEAQRELEVGNAWSAATLLYAAVVDAKKEDAHARLQLAVALAELGFHDLALLEIGEATESATDRSTRTKALREEVAVASALYPELSGGVLWQIGDRGGPTDFADEVDEEARNAQAEALDFSDAFDGPQGAPIKYTGANAAFWALAKLLHSSERDLRPLLAEIPNDSPYVPLATFHVAKRLVQEGISDGTLDDFSPSPILLKPEWMLAGLRLLEASEWPESLRHEVADAVTIGHIYSREPGAAVAALERLAARGDPRGHLRIRLSVARALGRSCQESTRSCSYSATGAQVDTMAELVYVDFCRSDAQAVTLEAAIGRAGMLQRWLLSQLDRDARELAGAIRGPSWTRSAGQLGSVVREFVLRSESVRMNQVYTERHLSALARLNKLKASERDSPLGRFIAGKLKSRLQSTRYHYVKQVREETWNLERSLQELLRPQSRAFWAPVFQRGLTLDKAVCSSREVNSPTEAKPTSKPPSRGRGCAGCSQGGSSISTLALLVTALLVGLFARSKAAASPRGSAIVARRHSEEGSASPEGSPRVALRWGWPGERPDACP